MKLLTPEQLADIRERNFDFDAETATPDCIYLLDHITAMEADKQYSQSLKVKLYRREKTITALEAEIKDHAKWAERMFNDPSSEPYRNLLERLETAEANAALNRAMEVTERERAEKAEEIAESLSNTIVDMAVEYAAVKTKLEKIGEFMPVCGEVQCLTQYIEVSEILEQESCKHGRGLTDYCEPCGRINGG